MGINAFLISLWLCVSLNLAGAQGPSNWRADYPPCKRHSELLKHGPMDLGVRIATANPSLARQFRNAMDFWAKIVDLDWYDDSTNNCSVQLADGRTELFAKAPEIMVARSQFPDRRDFQGWIVFNPELKLSDADFYRISVHEIGHMLGLQHNTRAASVMYEFELDGPVSLDAQDLASLAVHHRLRPQSTELVKAAARR